MKKVKKTAKKAASTSRKNPGLLIAGFVVVFLICYSGFELWRSAQLQSDIDSFKSSDAVRNILSDIDSFSVAVEDGEGALLCNVNVEQTLAAENIDTKEILVGLNERIERLQEELPSYGSVAVHLPSVRESRKVTREIERAVESLKELSTVSARAEYCYSLREVLSTSEFLRILAGPEGVSALAVGQLESLWRDFDDVQAELESIRTIPAGYTDKHASILMHYADFEALLRENPRDIKQFSLNIENKLLELEESLKDIQESAPELKNIPEQLQLQSAALR